jgi:hypothetical protein
MARLLLRVRYTTNAWIIKNDYRHGIEQVIQVHHVAVWWVASTGVIATCMCTLRRDKLASSRFSGNHNVDAAAMIVCAFVMIFFFVPETKQRTLEELDYLTSWPSRARSSLPTRPVKLHHGGSRGGSYGSEIQSWSLST